MKIRTIISSICLMLLAISCSMGDEVLDEVGKVVSNEFCAEMTRRHNHANILCMGGRVTSEEDAVKFTEIFLNTPEEGDRHLKRLAMIDEIEAGTFKVD